MKQVISFVLNGDRMELEVESHWTLLYLLREHLEITGTKPGCESGECGACTVLVNGKAINSCIFPAMEVHGATVITIEGLAKPSGELHPLQKAFVEHGGVQCGFCTPGMIMAAVDLLSRNPDPTDAEIRHAIEGNFCRCTGYQNIVAAIRQAAETTRSGAPVSA